MLYAQLIDVGYGVPALFHALPVVAFGAGCGLLIAAVRVLSGDEIANAGCARDGWLSCGRHAKSRHVIVIVIVIVIEMINGPALVISLMATSLIASRVSRLFAPPLYEVLWERYSGTAAKHPRSERRPAARIRRRVHIVRASRFCTSRRSPCRKPIGGLLEWAECVVWIDFASLRSF